MTNEVRNCKKLNFKKIYSQIAKYGRTIPELAEEYGMDEQAFIERMAKGLDPKLFSSALKTNERLLKQRKKETSKQLSTKSTGEIHEEELDMTKRNEAIVERNYRQRQSMNDKEKAKMKKRQTMKRNRNESEDMDALESRKADIDARITEGEKKLEEAKQILSIREEALSRTQTTFDKARNALNAAKSEHKQAQMDVEVKQQSLERERNNLEAVEFKIKRLKNETIYLVAPGYTGERPEYGTYYSTSAVNGFENLLVVEASSLYTIEPNLGDMVGAGYDSYKEYMEALRFVMLCAEYTLKSPEFNELVTDERIKKLLKKHVG